jgi:glycosyltransferase involved in cell wall biosynthesis
MELLYANLDNKGQLIKRLTTIPHCVEFPKEGYLSKNNAKLNVLFIGRDSPEKRFELILQIAKWAADQNLPYEFHIVGPEPTKFLSSDCHTIRWYRSISNREQINEIYRKVDVILLTSVSEGFPKVLAEAMAFSVIPVATKVGDIPMQIKTNVNGFITVVDDCVNESLFHLSNLHQDSDLRNRIRENAYSYAAENFKKERFKNDWKRIIEPLS